MPPLAYGFVGPFLPPAPVQSGAGGGSQNCPGAIAQDSIHGSFTSNVRGSAERWKEAISLPGGGHPGQPFQYNDFYLGMVVAGDPNSYLRQSYLEVVFTPVSSGPNTTVTWGVSAAVWAMHNETLGQNCSGSMPFVWNSSIWCIDNMLNNGAGLIGPSGLVGGSWFNITFDGVVANSSGMWVWANDSTNNSGSLSFELNKTTTGGVAYEPFFNASCNDLCFLNWSGAYGLGIGFDLCPVGSPGFAPCDTYNQTVWTGSPPIQFGPPEFWVNASAGYAGDYQYFAPYSASGQCSSIAIVPVANCNNYNAFGGTGFYPYFSWNGSLLNFGDAYPWTIYDPSTSAPFLGGEYYEYINTGPTQHDLVPLFLERITNDSRGGYLRPNTALNVSARISDLGVVRSVNFTYSLNGAAATTVPMTRLSGNSQRGIYNASVPSGGNGWINYTISAVNNASLVDSSNKLTVYRGPLPVFAVTVITNPESCTNATVNGTHAPNGTVLSLNPGTYPVSSTSCYPFQFQRWVTSNGLRVTAPQNISSNLTVTRAGTVSANWMYVRPNVTVTFQTIPTPCGTVLINNKTYGAGFGSVASLLYAIPTTVGQPTGCASESFAGWTLIGNLTVLGTTLIPGGNGTLIANFVLSSTGSTLNFHTQPVGCGGISYRGAGYQDGASLTVNSTPYPVAPLPCSHFGFTDFLTTGGATVSTGNLTVTSSGSITEQNYVLTEVLIETFPSFCTMTFDGVRYGNGTVLVVQNNSTHVVSQNPCPSLFSFSITVTPGLSLLGDVLTVNSSGTVLGNWLGSASQFLEFQTDPGFCGSISFGGGVWYNTNYTNVAENATGPITASPCANYGFVRWVPSPGLQISHGIAYVNSSGSIEAVFRPIATVAIETTPSACGSIMVNGVTYHSNDTAILTEDYPYPVTPVPCAHYSFVGWTDTVGATIVNTTLYLATDAILTANFLPTPYNVSIRIDPGTCGSVYVNGNSETNGSFVTLAYGTYPVRAAPCLGNRLTGYSVTGGVTVIGTTVSIAANGSLLAMYRPVPPSVVLGVPSSSFAGDIVSLSATIGVLVPPYNYTFNWSFGDGAAATTPANFTSHTYASPGTYHVSVTAHDPYGRNATANQTIQVVPLSSSSSNGVPVSTLAILAVFAVAVVALLALAYWRRRPPPAAAADGTAPADSEEPGDAVYLPAGQDGTGAPPSPSEDKT
jgi:PKD domain-containing protein